MSARPQTKHAHHTAQKDTHNISLDVRSANSPIRQGLILVGVSVLYFLAAKLGFAFAIIHSHVSPIWPPTGIAIAAILLFGYRVAPAILVGAFLANANGSVNRITGLLDLQDAAKK